MILYLLCGAVCGVISAKLMDEMGFVLGIVVTVAILYACLFLQLSLHEGGHLIAGLMSGYSFVSYRIGSVIFIKENGKLKIKKYALAGTGGQCLMEPPAMDNGKIPVVLYNMGGALMNIIVSVIAFLLYIPTKGYLILGNALLVFVIMGIGTALANGIPFTTGLVNNDGYNARNLQQNPTAMRAFWISLKANAEQMRGKILTDMPEEWFEMPADEDLQDALTASLAVYACNIRMEKHLFEEAEAMMTDLLAKETAVLGLHRVLLINDSIFCKCILGRDKEEIRKLMDKNQMKMMKAMKRQPSILRSWYAYEIYVNEDVEKAEKLLQQFLRLEKNYPYAADYRCEKGYVELVRDVW